MTATVEGRPCRNCGGTLRYASDLRCVPCRQAAGRARSVQQHTLHDDRRLGLASGFIAFATVQCDILRWIHEHRPCHGAEVTEALGLQRDAVSTALRMLQRHGFLHVVGKAPMRLGVRSSALFSTDPGPRRLSYRPVPQPERQAAYRARKKLRVASVFDLRGAINVTGNRAKSR